MAQGAEEGAGSRRAGCGMKSAAGFFAKLTKRRGEARRVPLAFALAHYQIERVAWMNGREHVHGHAS